MKIINKRELLALPDKTLYADVIDGKLSGLKVKIETSMGMTLSESMFISEDLIDQNRTVEYDESFPIEYHPEPTRYEDVSDTALFAIFETDDLNGLWNKIMTII